MRIVQLTASRFFGSLEWQMVELAQALPAGYETTIATFSEGGLCQPLVDRAAEWGLDARRLDNDTPRLAAATREIRGLLRGVAADVVCCHGYKANLLGGRAARSLGIPAVSISHGWTGESLKIRVYEAVDRFMLPRLDAVVCVSAGQADKVRAAGVAESRIRVIHNAVDASRFDAPDPAYRQRLEAHFAVKPKYIVGAAGRLSPEKGTEVLIRAAARIARQDSSVGFVIFGEGPERRKLEAQIQAAGIGNQVVLPGFVTDLDGYLPHFDVFALSSYTEGLPCVVLESLAARVPVVATAVGGTPEALTDGECGWLVAAGDDDALSQHIGRLLADDEMRATFGRNGRQRVQAEFSFTRQSADYLALFESLGINRAVSASTRKGDAQPALVG